MNAQYLLDLLKKYPQSRSWLDQSLARFAVRRARRVFLRRLGKVAAFAFATGLFFLLFERTPLQSEAVRYLTTIAFYGIALFFVFRAFHALFRPPGNIQLAQEIESIIPEFQTALISASEFSGQPRAGDGTSAALSKLTIAAVADQLTDERIEPVLKRYSRRFIFLGACGLSMLLGIWFFLSPNEVKRGLTRLVNPFSHLSSYSPLHLIIEPGNAVVARGESLQISATPNQEMYREPVLTLFKAGATEGTTTEMYPHDGVYTPKEPGMARIFGVYPDDAASRSKFVFTLTGLQESTDYSVSSEKFTSNRYSVTVLPRPDIKNLQLTILHPSYLGMQPQTLPDNVGDCTILNGSRLNLSVRATQKLGSAALVLEPPTKETLVLKGDVFTCEFSVATTTRYSVRLTNEFGLVNENPVKYQITVTEDAAPTVAILKPGIDLPFPTSKRLDLKVNAKDDFGVVAVLLYFSIGDRSHWIPLNMKSDFTPMKEFDVEYPWMLDTLAVQPGTEISYQVRAEDGLKPVPHVASTPTFKINMPSMYDVYRGADEAHQDVSKQLKDYAEAQKLRRESLSKTLEELKHEGKLDYETEKQLDKAIKEGEDSEKQAQEIMENFKNLQEKVENNPFATPETLQKMQKIGELLNQVLDDDAKKLMKQLQQSMKDMKLDPKDIEKFEQAFKMDDYVKNLDRSIELLEQARKEMKMTALGQALEDLRKRQEAIASETAGLEKKSEQGKLSDEDEAKLKDLRKQQGKVGEEMEDLQKKTKEIASEKTKEGQEEHPAMQDVRNLQDRLKQEDFKKDIQEIDQNMEKKNLENAQKGQQKMLKFLESLAKDGQKITKTCSGGGQPPQLDLSRFIRKSLAVSQDQESLLKRLDDLPDQFMRGQVPAIEGRIDECSILELLVKRQGQDLEDTLETFVRSSFQISPDILTPLSGVQGIFSEIVKDLEDRAIAKATQNQREIIRRFNLLAMELMKAQDQQQSSSASPMSALEQFKKLTQRQLSLYQQSQKQQMSPADQKLMDQLQKMSMEQRKVREALEQLMRDGKQQNKILGRMDDVKKDMEDLETKILDPKMRREVAEKQKAVYERMLKAQKSIKNRDEEKEDRKSEKARELNQVNSDKPLPKLGTDTRDLSKDYLTDLKEDFPRSYETEINDYYKSLNLYGNEEK